MPVEGSTLKPVPTLIPPNIDELALFTSIIPVEGSTLKPVPTLIPPKDDELALGKSVATKPRKLGAAASPEAGPAKTTLALAVIAPVPPLATGKVPVISETATPAHTGAVAAEPSPVCVKNFLVAAVLPVNKVVVLAALWYGIAPMAPPLMLVALLAKPVKLAVIVPAVKFPLASRATIAEAVFASVAVVAELLTLPGVAIVANLVSMIAAVVEMSALTISPSFILSDVTALLMIFTVVMASAEMTGAAAVVPVPAKSPANCTLPVAAVVAFGAPADKLLVTKAVVASLVELSPDD